MFTGRVELNSVPLPEHHHVHRQLSDKRGAAQRPGRRVRQRRQDGGFCISAARDRKKEKFKIMMPFFLWFTDSYRTHSVHALKVRMDISHNARVAKVSSYATAGQRSDLSRFCCRKT